MAAVIHPARCSLAYKEMVATYFLVILFHWANSKHRPAALAFVRDMFRSQASAVNDLAAYACHIKP